MLGHEGRLHRNTTTKNMYIRIIMRFQTYHVLESAYDIIGEHLGTEQEGQGHCLSHLPSMALDRTWTVVPQNFSTNTQAQRPECLNGSFVHALDTFQQNCLGHCRGHFRTFRLLMPPFKLCE